MKIFNLTADVTEKQDYYVDLDSEGYFCCPACKKAFLKFEDHQYHSTDPNYHTPRAVCSNCSAVFYQILQQ